ncbi:venom carboxylesterase-6 [Aedes aegypti]|uniref:Carboxylic ester hydrolase n=1 Tax=Aedes aegypti TaxID=7159 RepID=A0A903U0D7_AEDAE|nr:venom carboxylesterase-6 [Aedes aegypti]
MIRSINKPHHNANFISWGRGCSSEESCITVKVSISFLKIRFIIYSTDSSRMYGLSLIIPILLFNSIQTGSANDHLQCQSWCHSQPAVQINDGCLCGTKMDGLEAGPFDAFVGIPFAKPPVGRLRFANPVPIDPWKRYLNASTTKSMCIQKYDIFPLATIRGQEDCLYLNVYRPKKCKHKKLPVMVYIHGGGYIGESADPLVLGPEKFMDTRKVIIVTLQYRLGPFGFLASDDRSAPGNFGLKDQSLALRWVQGNIESFGGDRRRVTLFGHSAGAASVQLHMMSPLSEGLFSKAISQSGSALAFWGREYPDQLGLVRKLAVAAEVKGAERMSSEKLITALRKVDASKLLASVDKLKFWNNQPIILFRPVAEKYVDDETFIKEDPKELWAAGRYRKIPWMTGYLPNDGIAVLLSLFVDQLEPFIKNQQELLPLLADVPPSSVPLLYKKFFGGNPISPENAFALTQVYISKTHTDFRLN